jgi:predicted ATPase
MSSHFEQNDNNGSFTKPIIFSNKFYGRDEELETLHHTFECLCHQVRPTDIIKDQGVAVGDSMMNRASNETPLVLIRGYSGAGKSALVEKFAEQIGTKCEQPKSKSKPCYFLSGKFDAFNSGVSYSALVNAFDAFFERILKDSNPDEIQELKDAIMSNVGDEGRMLTNVVPSLQKVIGEQKVEATSVNMSKDFQLNRLSFIFKNFMKAICTEKRPVILFLDDLQWIDSASLDLMIDLITDNYVQHFMFVGAYRSNEVDETHLLSLALSNIEDATEIERVDLPTLTSQAIGEFIADTLSLDLEEITSLTDIVYKKTQGNIFFVRQAIEYLHRKGALCLSPMAFKWTWDVEKVAEITQLSDNVVDIVMGNIEALPENLQKALSTASFLMSTFDVDILLLAIVEIEGDIVNSDELMELLNRGVKEDLLNGGSTAYGYKFAHDRIKQAAYLLVPEGEIRDGKRLRIGKFLMKLGRSEEGEDWMLFVAADHFNALDSALIGFLDVAILNLEVGRKAMNVAAFVPALSYLQHGLGALVKIDGFWNIHYDLALDLHRATAEVELCLGHFERGNELSEIVIERSQSVPDKMRMKLTIGRALGKQNKAEDAMEKHMEALFMIDEFPKKFHLFHMLRDLSRVKKLFKKYSNNDILLLPVMKDENKTLAMEHLSELSQRAWICNDMTIALLAVLREVLLSFRHGLSADAAHAFYGYGIVIFGPSGDQEGAARMGRLSKEILMKVHTAERVKAKNRECCLLVNIVGFV